MSYRCSSILHSYFTFIDYFLLVNELPKTPPDQFYQLCYCTVEGSIVGVSTPFFFREVHEEDLMEFQKEQNKEFWTFRSRFAVLTDLYWVSLAIPYLEQMYRTSHFSLSIQL